MPVFRAFGVAVLCFAILALAAMPLLHLAGGQRRVFVALVLLVWAPYVAALLHVSRHPSLRWVGRLLLAGQVIVFGFQVLVPPVAVAALVGHLLLMAISSYLCGLARGLVAGAAGAAFTLLARAVAGGTAELDYFTLAIFAGMGIALVTLLDMTGREQRRAVAELYRLDEVKTTFLHAVSHDLRTPLTAVLGIAATLEQIGETLPAAERLELTTALAAKARRMDQLLSDLLDIDRLSRGAFDPSLTPADLGATVRSFVDELNLNDHTVVVDAEPVTALVDAPKLERVLENLLMNASKHTPRGTRLTVRIRSAGEEILMAVEDEGSGVPDDLKPTVFEPFERGIDPRSPGSGIGLAIVKGFTELQGGRVEVADRPGGGASFRVFLRVCPDPLEALAPERDTEIQTASPAAAHE